MVNKIQLIVTCNACGYVEHLDINSESDCQKKIQSFICPKGCPEKYKSYISIEQVPLSSELILEPELAA